MKAPPGFELNNPWKVCLKEAAEPRLICFIRCSADQLHRLNIWCNRGMLAESSSYVLMLDRDKVRDGEGCLFVRLNLLIRQIKLGLLEHDSSGRSVPHLASFN